jgi:hypothetical protein
MADSEQTPSKPEAGEQPAEQGSVFGNLPESRPGVRSPRRGKSRGAGRAGGTTAKSTPRQPRPAKEAGRPSPSGPAARPPSRPLTHEPAAPPPDEAEHGGIEDLAWAGVAVAAEAATLGVRLLSRAVEAVRKPADRR